MPKPLDKLPDEVKPLYIRATELRKRNSQIISRMERLGVAPELMTARFDHFLDKLTDFGIITDDQQWIINCEWEENLNQQLMQAEVRIRRQVQQQQAGPAVVERDRTIIGPNGRPLSSG